jgi:deoxycytidylate deaminase
MVCCLDCCKLLINAGIRRVVALKRYHADHDSIILLQEAGVPLVVINDTEECYTAMRSIDE